MKFLMKGLPWFAAFGAFLHTVFGTAEVHTPLLQSAIPREVSLLLYVCWHLITVVLIGSTIVLFKAMRAQGQNPWIYTARFIGALWFMFGLVFIGIALTFANAAMVLILGQWIILIPIGLLALFGTYPEKAPRVDRQSIFHSVRKQRGAAACSMPSDTKAHSR